MSGLMAPYRHTGRHNSRVFRASATLGHVITNVPEDPDLL